MLGYSQIKAFKQIKDSPKQEKKDKLKANKNDSVYAL